MNDIIKRLVLQNAFVRHVATAFLWFNMNPAVGVASIHATSSKNDNFKHLKT